MGGIGALSSACFEPAFLPKKREHGFKQTLFGMLLDQTGTKFGEHRGVESRIREFQTEQIFHIDPATHGISSALIRQVFDKLDHGNEGKPPGINADV